MKLLVLGGTRFIGPRVVEELVASGHQVTVFHRGETTAPLPPEVASLRGDLAKLRDHRKRFQAGAYDLVLHNMCMDRSQAEEVIEVFADIAGGLLVLSSGDVYRAFGRVVGVEEGPVEAAPLLETSPLRESRFPYRGRMKNREHYDKILVEQVVLGQTRIPSTIVRLPMVYGPRDYQARSWPYAKRMADQRPLIAIERAHAHWRPCRGYVDNIAHAIALAATSERARGEIYHVADDVQPSELEWIEAIAEVIGWRGRIELRSADRVPKALGSPGNVAQDVHFDTAKIRQHLGYACPVPFEVAVARTIEWQLAHPPDAKKLREIDYAAEDAVLALEESP